MKSTGLTVLLMILSAAVIFYAGSLPFIALMYSPRVDVASMRLFKIFWYGDCLAVPLLIWRRHKRVAPKKAEPVQASQIDMNDSSY
ncbi:MAG: hypothetical protein WCR70_05345 [Sphaerochaetaceae bacterium]